MPLSSLAIWVVLLELTEMLIHVMGFPEREVVCAVCKGLIGEEFYSTLSL